MYITRVGLEQRIPPAIPHPCPGTPLGTRNTMSQRLVFTTSCLLNTTASNATDVVYYDIQTPEWEPHLTTVRRLDPRTGMYEFTGSVRNELDKPVAVSVYGGELEPTEQWLKKVDGTKPGERWEQARITFGLGRTLMGIAVADGNSMMARETCLHGAWPTGNSKYVYWVPRRGSIDGDTHDSFIVRMKG